MKRALLFVLLLSLGILTACKKNEPLEVTDSESENVTIRVVTMFGAADVTGGVYGSIREKYQKENPNVSIIDESRASDEQWKTSVVADFCAGNEPDILQFFTDATANQLIAMDKFVTIDEIREEYPEYACDTYDWALKQVANSDGIERAVPTTGYWEGLYCNVDLFDAYNIELPTDWNSFMNAVVKFKNAGVVPVACSVNNVPHYWLEHFLLTKMGPDKYEQPITEMDKDLVSALKDFKVLWDVGAFPSNTASIDNSYAGDLFVKKKAAMILEGNWFFSSLEDKENVVLMPFPGLWKVGEERVVIGGLTSGFYISRRAWNNPAKRDACVKFVMANTSAEAVEKYWAEGGGITTTATFVNEPESDSKSEQSARNYIARASRVVLSTDSRMEPQAYQKLIAGVLDVMTGGSPEELLEKVLELNK